MGCGRPGEPLLRVPEIARSATRAVSGPVTGRFCAGVSDRRGWVLQKACAARPSLDASGLLEHRDGNDAKREDPRVTVCGGEAAFSRPIGATMSTNDHRSASVRQQARRQADRARAAMQDKREGQEGGSAAG
jgi:hypothetical protein